MQRLGEYHAAELVERALGFIQVRLSSRDYLGPIADEVAVHRQALKSAMDGAKTALEKRMAATAEIEWRDTQLDRAVMNLSLTVLAKVGNNRKDPLYQGLFPIAPSTAMKGTANDSQTQFVGAILSVHAQNGRYAQFDTEVETIEAAADAVDQAITERDKRYVEEATTNRNLAQVTGTVRRFYNQLHPRLLILEDDRDLVESFFYRFRSSSGGGGSGSNGGDDGPA